MTSPPKEHVAVSEDIPGCLGSVLLPSNGMPLNILQSNGAGPRMKNSLAHSVSSAEVENPVLLYIHPEVQLMPYYWTFIVSIFFTAKNKTVMNTQV